MNSLRIARESNCLVELTCCVLKGEIQQKLSITDQKGLSSFSTKLKCFIKQWDC